MIWSAGAQLYAWNFSAIEVTKWACVTGMYRASSFWQQRADSLSVNVNVQGAASEQFEWGYLASHPKSIRIFKGPPETCNLHPWDAMILRDCTENTSSLYEIEHIASRKWDILVMKMCKDYDCEFDLP